MSEESGRVTRAAGIVGFFTLLSRIAGLLRDVVVAYLFGSQGAADAFFVAFRIPNLLRRLTAEGALTVAFIPIFTSTLNKEGKAEAIKVAQIVFTFAALALAAVTLLGMWLAEPITLLFAPGFLAEPEKFSLTVGLTRLMFPYILFVSLVALAMGVLNAFRHFMAPALSPVLFNLSIIGCALILTPILAEPVQSLAYGVLLGGVVQLLLQWPYLRRYGLTATPNFQFGHPALRRLVWLMAPAVFGAAVYQVNLLVSTMLASVLPQGSVSYLYYADRLLEFPVGVFAVALGTAALPSFSHLLTRGDKAGLCATLVHGLRLVNFITLPAAAGLAVIAVPVFAIFFQHGAFDAATTVQSARALQMYALGLWGISGLKLVAPVFYAMEDMKTPVWVAFVSFLLNFVLSVAFMGPVDSGDVAGWAPAAAAAKLSVWLNVLSLQHAGLALATSISATFNFLVLLIILHARLRILPLAEVAGSFLRNFVNAVLMAAPLLLIARSIDWNAAERGRYGLGILFVAFVALVVSGMFLYLLLSRLLKSPEWHLINDIQMSLRTRLKRQSS
ncbi:MAG TPA: murein biosynthesis integral membrane protein MurJ [Candidatus Binatia bacterium]|nr:murein biosynthesis integral membrane protein MurJ [Candidatus Binatia bacterium]